MEKQLKIVVFFLAISCDSGCASRLQRTNAMSRHRRRADSHAFHSTIIEHGSAFLRWWYLPSGRPTSATSITLLLNGTFNKYDSSAVWIFISWTKIDREKNNKKHLNFHFLLFCLPSADKQRQPQNSISSKPRESQRRTKNRILMKLFIHSHFTWFYRRWEHTHTHAETHSRHVDPRISASLCRGINAMINHYSLPLRARAD